MISRVIISPRLIASFRKAAVRAYPNEFFQTMWGWVRGDTVTVEALRDAAHTPTDSEISTTVADQFAPHSTTPLHYLGTIHSHPDCGDTSPSVTDWDDGFTTGETVFFVMSVRKGENGRFRTDLRPWEPRPPIAIVYPRVRGERRRREKAVGVEESEKISPQRWEDLKTKLNSLVPTPSLDTPASPLLQSSSPETTG